MGIVSAVLFYILIAVITDRSAEEQRGRIFVACLLMGGVLTVLSRSVSGLVGLMIWVAVGLSLAVVTLVFWIRVERGDAFRIAGWWIGIQVALAFVLEVVRAALR